MFIIYDTKHTTLYALEMCWYHTKHTALYALELCLYDTKHTALYFTAHTFIYITIKVQPHVSLFMCL